MECETKAHDDETAAFRTEHAARAFASVHTKEEKLPYDIADRVLHTRFGEGTVVAIVEGGRDYEVTVQFDTVGIKKMFASFAKLKKL